MKFLEYQQLAERTEAPITGELLARLSEPETARLLHGAIGLCTEAGELQDAIKRHVYYGKPLNRVNLLEELGDVLWYVALVGNFLGVSLEIVAERNIEKLRSRYPEKFDEHHAINRDLAAEQKILEGGKAE